MLLLVLILVLLAFGLLVVALLSSSVLWAWVSVGVSVAAAAVLLVDWLQRRNAVKAGAETSASPGSAPAPRAATATADIEPVTEIMPVIPRSGPVPPAEDTGNDASQDVPDERFAPTADVQQTIVMPIVQPSGSSDRPSGATRGTAPSGGDSSPTVTKTGVDRSPSTPSSSGPGDAPAAAERGAGGPGAEAGAGSDAQPTVAAAVPPATAPAHPPAREKRENKPLATEKPARDAPTVATPSDVTVPARIPGGPGPSQEKAAEQGPEKAEPKNAGASRADVTADATTPASTGAGRADIPGTGPTGVDAGEVAPAVGAAPAQERPSASDKPDEQATVAVDARSAGSRPADTGGAAAGAVVAGGAATGGAAAVAGGNAAGTTAAGAAPADPTSDRTADHAVDVPAGGEPADTAAAPSGPDGEPPEEPRDPAAAALVAGLDDEVLVVDEQPRYHVDGCRALADKPLIPLPAQEAVELGFTPCGWCSPDVTLAGRHPAPAR